jgi:hypothetical protein
LEDLGVEGKLISERILKKYNGGVGVEWIGLVRIGGKWRAVVDTAMELRAK